MSFTGVKVNRKSVKLNHRQKNDNRLATKAVNANVREHNAFKKTW